MIPGRQRYPFSECSDRTPLPDSVRTSLRERWSIARWNGEGALYSVDADHGRVLRRVVSEALGSITEHLEFLNEEEAPAAASTKPGRYYENIDRGVPVEEHLAMTYWRKRSPMPEHDLDPDRDRCGLLWVSPVVPLTGRHVTRVVGEIEALMQAYDLEPNIGLNSVFERTLVVTAAIVYDRDAPGEEARSMRCYERLMRRLIELGYPPYRLTTHSMMADLCPAADFFPTLIQRLKLAVDPADILAPGRYDFRTERLSLQTPNPRPSDSESVT